jgi:hypothetical protein
MTSIIKHIPEDGFESELGEKNNKKNTIRWVDTYKNHLDMKEIAVSDKAIEKFAEDVVKWAKTPKALCISSFPSSIGVPHSTWNRWMDKFPVLKDANDLAKELIGVRREEGVMTGEFRDSMIKTIHGSYSSLWRQNEERLAQLNKDVNTPSNTPITVEIHASPITDVVPVLERD